MKFGYTSCQHGQIFVPKCCQEAVVWNSSTGPWFAQQNKSFTGKDFPSTSMRGVYCDETDEPPRFHNVFFLQTTLGNL
jgi:hypothetical protein